MSRIPLVLILYFVVTDEGAGRRYTHRALELPSSAFFSDLNVTRPIWAVLPVARLVKQLGIHMVAPGWTRQAEAYRVIREQKLTKRQGDPAEWISWTTSSKAAISAS